MQGNLRSFLLGTFLSILVLASFFFGAIADRIFVIKPLDAVVRRTGGGLEVASVKPDGTVSLLPLPVNGQYSVAEVVDRATPSVLTVSIRRQEQRFNPFSFGPFGFQLPGEMEEVQRDIGTGFVVDSSGLVVTNKHVVSDVQASYLVIDKDNKEYTVTDIYRDPANDLAIIRVEGLSKPALPMGDSDSVRVGEPAIAIGTALGEFPQSVTSGIVSGVGRGIQAGGAGVGLENLENVIQTDAAINPGNSGGPLLNAAGEVIGVNVAVTQGAENIGFAIPINIVKESINNFNETGQFDRAFFGVRYQRISEQAALANEVPQGTYVVEVVEGSAAAEAGIRTGDILTKFNGHNLSEEDLATLINQTRVGDKVAVEYWRDNQRQTVSVTLRSLSN
jgi:serine protease Do